MAAAVAACRWGGSHFKLQQDISSIAQVLWQILLWKCRCLKFKYSEKARKIWKISHQVWNLPNNFEKRWKIFFSNLVPSHNILNLWLKMLLLKGFHSIVLVLYYRLWWPYLSKRNGKNNRIAERIALLDLASGIISIITPLTILNNNTKEPNPCQNC